jgi:peptide-methionine (S)-S-oxide reductase
MRSWADGRGQRRSNRAHQHSAVLALTGDHGATNVARLAGEGAPTSFRRPSVGLRRLEIVFDPERISYRDILEFFFQIHDPTTKDRQGNDIGSSYRSKIFYTSDEQRQVAEDTIADVDASGLWPGKVVTEVSEAVPFWEAEPEHQDYLQRYPNGYTCHSRGRAGSCHTARRGPNSDARRKPHAGTSIRSAPPAIAASRISRRSRAPLLCMSSAPRAVVRAQ